MRARHVLIAGMVLGAALGCAGGMAVRTQPPPPPPGAAVTLRSLGVLPPPDGRDRFDPVALAIDARGRVLVADRARGTIFIYDGAGPPSGWLADPPATIGASRFQDVRSIVTGSGLLTYVLDGGTGTVYSYDLSDQYRGTLVNLTGSFVGRRFGLVRASGLALDASGRAYLTDVEGDRVLVFDPQWNPLHEIGGPGTTMGGFRDPAAIAVGPAGRLFVADRGNRLVQIFDALGSFLEEVTFPHPPESIAVDRKGRAFVGDAVGVVTVLLRDRPRVEYAPGRGAGPAYLTVSSDGSRLYVARPARGHVEVIGVEEVGAADEGGGGGP